MTNCSALDKPMEFGRVSLKENFPEAKATQALVRRACMGSKEGIDSAVREGAHINDPGRHNIPPLFWTIANACKEGVRLLIQTGADANGRMLDNATPVWFAASEADAEILGMLLDAGGDPNHVARDSSPLLEAAGAGRWDNMKLLISRGADINWKAKRGSTVASYAAAGGQFSEVLLLLNSGYRADLDRIAWTAKNRVLPKESDQQRYREQVILKLRELGVD